jgi:asparagine synthase (glutamine-hydrolysing)
MRALREKYILKRAAAPLVPASVRARTKQPYRAPDAKSFFDPSTGRARAPFVDEVLDPACLRANGVFDANAVGILADKARSGKAVSARDNIALVAILSSQLWIDQFVARRGERASGGH